MMMTFKKMMDEFDDEFDEDAMDNLTKIVDNFAEEVREHDPKTAEKFLLKVDLLLNPHFTKEAAEYAVECLKNKDGTSGEHWSYETTTQVLENNGYSHKAADWFYVLNMIYSDYYKPGRSDETYVELAHDFLDDPDGPEGKAKKYYWAMKKAW